MEQALASREGHAEVRLSKMPAQGDLRYRAFEWRTTAAVGREEKVTSISGSPVIKRRKTATRSDPNFVLRYSEIDRLSLWLREAADVG